MKTIPFGYPRRGLTGLFNTFRLGQGRYASLVQGERVELTDARSKRVLKTATVVAVHVGPLDELAPLHADHAHNWRDHPGPDRPALLKASLAKHYPPGRVRDSSVVTVVYLKEDEAPCQQECQSPSQSG